MAASKLQGRRARPAVREADGSLRRAEIIDAAARVFARLGYQQTSIRKIATEVGLLGGSLYHHINSKEDLFLEVHGRALTRVEAAMRARFEGVADPWERLRLACVAHVEMEVEPGSVTLALMGDLRSVPTEVRAKLITQRDAFETMYVELVDALDIAPGIDRSVLRLSLLTLLNGVVSWYRPGRLSPGEIGEQIFRIVSEKIRRP